MSRISLIITAGGSGSRFGKINKLLAKINNKTIIEYCVEKFLPILEINEIIIPTNKNIIPDFKEIFEGNKKINIIEGGINRQESVYKALNYIKNTDYVLIHDGARPMVTTEKIKELIKKMKEKNAVIMAVKTIDTIKKVKNDDNEIISTIDRKNLYNTQTPQGFEYNLIMDAHEKLKGQEFTDDSGMLEFLNKKVYIVDGDYTNFKITTTFDLEIMKLLINKPSNF